MLKLMIRDVLVPNDENMQAGLEHFSSLVKHGKSRMEFVLLKKDGSHINILSLADVIGFDILTYYCRRNIYFMLTL